MGTRRLSREQALQALFYMDMHRDPGEDPVGSFCNSFTEENPAEPFFHRLVCGVQENRETIDTVIEQFSSNWKLSRMSCVDRNVLRIAAFELLFCADIPPKVSINEAIDVGKRFGTEESGAFINGILDSLRIAIEENQVSCVPKATGQSS
ncbi:N utilization substance protein B [Desulfosarcina alkanivorans]|jgi:N utilization substance protein B|uniref:Transcription antitermination protein NusB n=1 Tax=Desulfosarcina alkanivorans TaxID=571177 RepID=A0A5K7YLM3_9BACT|nr:transcription antitermination factor NusB [Desulfosarcina alkanivorans]BBO69120.1 N utilization substance protein B [Desulfosarcina alkanivorans]